MKTVYRFAVCVLGANVGCAQLFGIEERPETRKDAQPETETSLDTGLLDLGSDALTDSADVSDSGVCECPKDDFHRCVSGLCIDLERPYAPLAPARFVRLGDFIHDENTTLSWTAFAKSAPADDLFAMCAALDVDGIKDLRAPTLTEVLGLLENDRPSPHIDPIFVPEPKSDFPANIYSLTRDADGDPFYVGFDIGVAYASRPLGPVPTRCVRGPTKALPQGLVEEVDGIRDRVTKLLWSKLEARKAGEKLLSFAEASVACKAPFRMPTLSEYTGIAMVVAPFEKTVSSYWTSTAGRSKSHRTVVAADRTVDESPEVGVSHGVRCVKP